MYFAGTYFNSIPHSSKYVTFSFYENIYLKNKID